MKNHWIRNARERKKEIVFTLRIKTKYCGKVSLAIRYVEGNTQPVQNNSWKPQQNFSGEPIALRCVLKSVPLKCPTTHTYVCTYSRTHFSAHVTNTIMNYFFHLLKYTVWTSITYFCTISHVNYKRVCWQFHKNSGNITALKGTPY